MLLDSGLLQGCDVSGTERGHHLWAADYWLLTADCCVLSCSLLWLNSRPQDAVKDM